LQAASKLGLGKDAGSLAKLVPQKEFSKLVAALVRVALNQDFASFQENAPKLEGGGTGRKRTLQKARK
jgi:hypothetical protein